VKKLVLIAALAVLSPLAALAQSSDYAYPYPAATPLNRPTPGTLGYAAVDQYGNVQVTLGGTGTNSTVNVVATPGAASILKANQGTYTSTDAVVAVGGERNEGGTDINGSDARYATIALNSKGTVYADINSTLVRNIATSLMKLGTTTWNSGDGGVPPLFYRESSLSTTGVNGTDGRYTNGKADSLGALWTRPAGNQDTAALITAAGATTTQTGADQTNLSGRGAICVLDMTVVGTGSVTLEIDGKDAASGKYYALLTGAAVVTNSTNVYTVYPGNTVAANVSASTVLPKTWRVKTTANNANAATYTVGCSVVQ
jgi:hypothetical protein